MTQNETRSPQSRSYSATLPRATAETIKRAGLQIFSAYRAADYGDAEGFGVQLSMVLAEFSEVTVRFISDPRTGIQRRSTFAPTIAEIITACEEHERYLDRTAPTRSRPARLEAPPRSPKGGFTWADLQRMGVSRPIGFFETAEELPMHVHELAKPRRSLEDQTPTLTEQQTQREIERRLEQLQQAPVAPATAELRALLKQRRNDESGTETPEPGAADSMWEDPATEGGTTAAAAPEGMAAERGEGGDSSREILSDRYDF